jgi:hypothetical protein
MTGRADSLKLTEFIRLRGRNGLLHSLHDLLAIA